MHRAGCMALHHTVQGMAPEPYTVQGVIRTKPFYSFLSNTKSARVQSASFSLEFGKG